MSVLEIILYAVIGSATAIYVTVTIVKWVRNKKKTGDKKNENSRDAENM